MVVLGACRIGFDALPRDGALDGTSDTSMGDAPAGLQFVYLKASNADFFDRFGWSVAVSLDGNTVAVGAPLEDGPAGLSGSGSVYVFVRTGGVWSEQAYLRASTPDPGDSFGAAVALSADGNTLAVGLPDEDSAIGTDSADNSLSGAGAVFTFTRSGTTWSQEAYLKAAFTGMDDHFGGSLALSADGNRIAIGAPHEDSDETGTSGTGNNNSAIDAGAVYTFTRVGATWSPEAYIKASNAEAGDEFGFSLALSADSGRLVVGAPSEDSAATTVNGNQTDESIMSGGAAYAYNRVNTTWLQQAYVKPSSIDFGDSFGRAMALSRDGRILVIAAPGEDQFQLNSGAVFTFAYGDPTWAETAKLKAFTVDDGDQYGVSVAATTTGADLYMGAPNEDSSAVKLGGNQADNSIADSGAAYAYSRHVSGDGWMVGFYGKATAPGPGDLFGFSMAVNGDGRVVAAGAPYEDSSARGIDGDATNDDRMDSGAVVLITY